MRNEELEVAGGWWLVTRDEWLGMSGQGLGDISRQTLISSFRAPARNLCHSCSGGQRLEIPNRKPAVHFPSGIAIILLRGASIFLCAAPPFRISHF